MTNFERFKVCAVGIHTQIAEIVSLYIATIENELDLGNVKPLIEPLIGAVLIFSITAHSAYGVEVEDNPIVNWEHVSKPKDSMVAAKLSHFASIIFTRVYGYGEECMEAGLDYDLKMLVSFLSLLASHYELGLDQIMQKYCPTIG